MTDFEKYQASAEARRDTHGDHLHQLTGYFLAETNRMREQHEAPPAVPREQPVEDPVPPKARKRFRWPWRG